MKKTNTLGVGILAFFCIFSFIFSGANGEDITSSTIYVGGNGPGNYTGIQDALDNITAGGTVYVFPGMYHEHIIITTPVHLIGDNKNNTIIDGDNEEYVIILDAGISTLSGFTITNSQKKFPFAGIYVNSDYNTISNNILTDNFYGMQLGYAIGYNLIINNTIFHNVRCGIYFNHASNNRLIGNVVFDHPVNGFGLYEFSNNNSIINNTFSENRYTGVNIRESYNNQVIGNTFIQDQVGLHKPSPEYHSVVRDNIFTHNIVSLEEERDAVVFTVVIFDILVFFVFLVFRKFFT
jgi:nitrous oxidase accessory protein